MACEMSLKLILKGISRLQISIWVVNEDQIEQPKTGRIKKFKLLIRRKNENHIDTSRIAKILLKRLL